MQLIRITDPQDAVLEQLIPLYEEAFPIEERRPLKQIEKMISQKKEMYFNALFSDGDLCGLFVYWDLGEFYYLEHLAVFPEMRNRKIGAQVLDYVAKHLEGIRLLEVEPTTDEMTTRRVAYYRRNGYEILDQNYIQPSYTDEKEAFNLWIMGNKESDRLAEYIQTIKERVYVENR